MMAESVDSILAPLRISRSCSLRCSSIFAISLRCDSMKGYSMACVRSAFSNSRANFMRRALLGLAMSLGYLISPWSMI